MEQDKIVSLCQSVTCHIGVMVTVYSRWICVFLLEVLAVVKAFQLSIPGRLVYHCRILA